MATAPRSYWPKAIGRAAALIVTVLVALLHSPAAPAQETVLALEFDFSKPGARSLGFGGAFAALADDATAAFANPAGLVQLSRSEVSIEGRNWGSTMVRNARQVPAPRPCAASSRTGSSRRNADRVAR